jgi:hypothetical protein
VSAGIEKPREGAADYAGMKMPGEDPRHHVQGGRDHVCPLALPAVLAGCLAWAAGIDRSRKFARLACRREQHHRVRHCDRKQVEREE